MIFLDEQKKETAEIKAPQTEAQNENLLQIGAKAKHQESADKEEKKPLLQIKSKSSEQKQESTSEMKQSPSESKQESHEEKKPSHQQSQSHHMQHHAAKKKPFYKNLYFYLAIFLILIIAGGIFVYLHKQVPQNVLVEVNGESITTEELQKEIALLPPQYATVMNKAQLEKTVLDQLILKKLLLNEAKAKNLQATDDDVNKAIDKFLLSAGLTKEEFMQRLAQEKSSYDEVTALYKEQIAINNLLTQEVFSKIIIPEQTLQDYYDQNKADLVQLHASHILFCYNSSLFCEKNRTEEAAISLGSDVKKQLDSGKSFEDLAKQYSDDPSAKNGGDLGWFGKGEMVLSFEEAAMKLKTNEVSPLVKTQFGYHLIKLTAKNESFQEVKQVITQKLSAEKKQAAVKDYLDSLKQKAVIIYTQPQN